MNYQETIQFLYDRLPMFTRIGAAAYKKDLHNTIALLDKLEQPQLRFKTLHIAGTNGKGSTSHMLAAILQEHGYKTGLYTSPHLYDFRERIKINGMEVPETFITAFVNRLRPFIEELEPSFFEVTVAMAFEWFAQESVDIAVIETGLGGRLDSTNVIDPELSIITNIGWDHMHMLGDTLEKIAFEKAGIIKQGKPVVIGGDQEALLPVFRSRASECNSRLWLATDLFTIEHAKSGIRDIQVALTDRETGEIIPITSDLPGIYQQYNLRTVMATVKVLKQAGWKLNLDLCQKALANVKGLTGLAGRWEVLAQNPLVIMDVAHNEDGIRQVLQQLEQLQHTRPACRVFFIMGMVKDKEIIKVLQLLPRPFKYLFTQAQLPRALPAADLLTLALEQGLSGYAFAEVNQAIQQALELANSNDIIMICGSVFVVGEVNRNAITSASEL